MNTHNSLKQTALFSYHQEHAKKRVNFAGYDLPLFYTSPVIEHRQVRESAGLFDVSHMGVINVQGKGAESFLDKLSTNSIQGRAQHSATYTLFCNEQGKVLEDLIIFKRSEDDFFLVVNAGNKEKIAAHLTKHLGDGIKIEPLFESQGILALQGPKAPDLVRSFFQLESLPGFMKFSVLPFKNSFLTLSTTGYTGSLGFEIIASQDLLLSIWEALLTHSDGRCLPIGLAARDSLRLEAGFALYGHELSEQLYPFETLSAWTLKTLNRDFLGKESILAAKSVSKKSQIAVTLQNKLIPRSFYSVLENNQKVGYVTSGAYSPILDKGIAIVQLEQEINGQDLSMEIRDKQVPIEKTTLPFCRLK